MTLVKRLLHDSSAWHFATLRALPGWLVEISLTRPALTLQIQGVSSRASKMCQTCQLQCFQGFCIVLMSELVPSSAHGHIKSMCRPYLRFPVIWLRQQTSGIPETILSVTLSEACCLVLGFCILLWLHGLPGPLLCPIFFAPSGRSASVK